MAEILKPNEIMHMGDIIHYKDGHDMIVDGLSGCRVDSMGGWQIGSIKSVERPDPEPTENDKLRASLTVKDAELTDARSLIEELVQNCERLSRRDYPDGLISIEAGKQWLAAHPAPTGKDEPT